MTAMTFDVVLVGNGIIAQAIAIELKIRCRSLRIAIVGPPERLGAGSAAAGAMLGCFGEVTHTSRNSSTGLAKFDLCRSSSRRWKTWISDINYASSGEEHIDFIRGTIVIENAISGTLDADNFDSIISTLETEQEGFEHLLPRDIAGIHPVPSSRPIRALFLPSEDAVDSGLVHKWLLGTLRRLGVELIAHKAKSLVASSGAIKGVVLESGDTIHASHVVCAAGAYTTPLLDTVLDPMQVQPVFAGVGIAFVSSRNRESPLCHAIRTVNRGGSCGLHAIPMHGGFEYVGATNAIVQSPATSATAGLSHFLLQCAIDQVDQWYSHHLIDHWRIGNRPVTLDTFPLIGSSGLDGLFIATGTYREGFLCSPVIAQIIADEILDGTVVQHPFVPTRQPISVYSIDESLSECSHHAVCTGFEASLILPRLWPHDVLYESFNSDFRTLCADLGLTSGLPPDMIPFLAGSRTHDGVFARVKQFLAARGMTIDSRNSSAAKSKG